MKTKFSGFLTLLLALAVQLTFAQQKTISGTVTDETGPLPGVTILIKGTAIGTETDFDGNYSISANTGDVLVFSFVGMKTVEKKVGNATTINLIMESDNLLEEVVVVGYGAGKKLGSIVGSVVQVSSESIKEKPSANVLDALQGKVPGLQIFSSSGEPSATQSIRLHGVGSLGSSSTPLFVIDGIPVSDGSLVSLNSNDFESVTVLKDASATSIYGSRAANGVVYITTKKGKRNQEATITISSQYGVSNMANTDFFESVMNRDEFLDFMEGAGYYDAGTIDYINTTFPDTDTKWWETYYKKNQPTLQMDVSVNGGGEKTSYYVSGGFYDQQGLAYQSDFKRYTLRSNIDTKVSDWFQMGLNVGLGYDDRQSNPSGSNSTNRGLALLAQPFYSPVDEDGNPYMDGTIPGWGRYHPAYREKVYPANYSRLNITPSGYIQINPIKNVTFKSQMGIEFYDVRESSQRLPSFVGSLGNGSAYEDFERNITQTITNTLEYSFNINDIHDFTVLAGQEYVKNEYENFSASSNGHNDDRLLLLSAGPDNRDVSQYKSEYVFNSYFGRFDYSFDNKYFLDVTVRRDGSSRFGENNKYANFWSAGLMWRLKSENFLKDVSWLDNLNLKVSTGTSGNAAIGNYNSLATVGTNQYNTSTGWNISAPGNTDLSWENQRKTTFAVNTSFFDRVRLDVEYYIRTTEDMLVSVPYPYTSGFANITSNVGSLENKGIDVALDFDIVKGSDYYVTPYVSLNYNENKVTELFQGRDYWIIPNTGVAWAVGKPVSLFYPVFSHIDSQTGVPYWYVPNADPDKVVEPNFDPNNVTSDFNTAALQQSTGKDRYPPLNGGFGLSAGYKGFFLTADFAFSQGKYLINNDRYFFENPTVFTGFNTSKRSADYWQNPGDETLFPSLDYQFTQFDSRLIEDASFVRLKTLQFGYNVPEKFLKNQSFLKSLRLYVIGRNLLTWTEYLGPDPEVDSNLALGTNPNTKQVSFGVEIKL
ncbi:TonB-dependent receptor [Aureibaculum marinum]|uniref:TonB-dependent receptor n=1 Tax=Aureibaculum marinum TaxID=2487930 RepID=A0A3N4NUU2_9FLAO|nr:TonB-dependent receptor [Aureibaculum marinum]RPE00133.1 TonB-dependent receptor [Aureibaculum marinum]